MGERSDMGNQGESDTGDTGDKENKGDRRARNAGLPAVARAKRDAKAGYEYLLAYKITVPIYDYTTVFCERWILPIRGNGGIREEQMHRSARTADQMIQAARSVMSNIVEGNKHVSLKGYIYLAGIARGSFEELLKDYLSYARQRKIRIWERERAIREIREIGLIWEMLRATPTLPDIPHFPNLPEDPEKAVNLLLTLINQGNYLLDKLVFSLKEKHKREGGFTEKLYRDRVKYRRVGG